MHKRRSVELREDLVGLTKPDKVEVTDRTITLRGVKLLGLESKNGRRYSATAAKAAIPLYEGAKINADHPDKPRDRRSAHDRLGKAVNVKQGRDGGLYGDAILLRSHPLATTVAEAVQEGMEDAFAFSHNADGEARTGRDGFLEVEEITAVRSVDLVADGATNHSLFEGREAMAKKKPQTTTLRALIEAMDEGTIRTALLEMGDDELMGAELPAPDVAADTGDWKQDLVAAIGKLVASEDAADHEMAKKVMNMLKPEGAEKPAEGAAKEGEGDDADKDKDDDTDKAKAKEEAVKHQAKGTPLTEAKAKSLCDLAGVKHDKALLESLVDLPEDIAIIARLKGQASKTGPRSSSPASLTEGDDRKAKPVKDAKSFVEAITSPDDEDE
jgi:hypothetical protein